MRLVIAGSRDVEPDHDQIREALRKAVAAGAWGLFAITEVVSGAARGADRAGEDWARAMRLPIKRFPADWDRHGKGAGPIRNEEMARYADAALVFWRNNSTGSANMIAWMVALQKPVWVVRCR